MGERMIAEQSITAVKIGRLYRKAAESQAESTKLLLECGAELIAEKETKEHGEWLPWLKANKQTLGFGISTADKLMSGARNYASTTNLTPESAVTISRQIWGNDDSAKLIVSSQSNEWYTPPQYIDSAKAVMGEIDLDPASCNAANKIVKAGAIYDQEKDGLEQPWAGRVWLNPPWGDLGPRFVQKLLDSLESGDVTAAILLANSHCTDAEWFQPLWNYTLCFTDHRIDYWREEENHSSSTHGSVFVYFGPKDAKFAQEFSKHGAIVRKYLPGKHSQR